MPSEQEAREIVRRVQKAALEFTATIVAPLYWVGRNPDGTPFTRNGTAFFLKTKDALFGVTAAHVIEGKRSWREHCDQYGKTNIRLGGKRGTSASFDWDARCVDINLEMGEKAAIGIAHVTPDGRWLRVNPALRRILGYTADELLAKSLRDVTYPDDLAADLARAQLIREGKIESYEIEKRLLRKDGVIIWARKTAGCVRGNVPADVEK